MSLRPNSRIETATKTRRAGVWRGRPAAGTVILLLSGDPSMYDLIAENSPPPWTVERTENPDSGCELALSRNLGLVVVDDEVLAPEEREWFLGQINRLAPRPPIIYVASKHTPEVEKIARTQGAIYYTSKPLETERVGWVLLNFLRHLSERDSRQAGRHPSQVPHA